MSTKKLGLLSTRVKSAINNYDRSASDVRIFYSVGKKWVELGSVDVADRQLKIALDAARKNGLGVYRPSAQRKVYFWVPSYEAVLEIKFLTAIKEPSQARARGWVLAVCESALNEYRATYDQLTHLRNRSAFDQRLVEVLDGVRLSGGALSEVESQSTVPSSVVLASLDVDHFKSVNDRFGHGYGDLVLAALGWRMEEAFGKIQCEADDRFSVELFRLGGEEFQVLFYGQLSESDAIAAVEVVQEIVRSRSLPDDQEFETLRSRAFADNSPLPHQSDRCVTVSAGVSIAQISIEEKISVAAGHIKREADLALTSAKLGGRDCVRRFSDILQKCGRVTFVDKANGVIAIDVGREVGAKKGQEFFVFPPNYGGGVPFFLGDGRSKRHVGTFPRFRSARIAAFAVQDAVSFCRVVKAEAGVVEILEGSTLEAIPLGSISHLFTELSGFGRVSTRDELIVDTESLAETSSILIVAVTLPGLEKVSDEHGIDVANDCLGRLSQQVVSFFGSKAKFGLLNTNAVVAVLPLDGNEGAANRVAKLQEHISKTVDDRSDFGIGWVCKEKDEQPEGLENSESICDLFDASLLASNVANRNDAEKYSPRALRSALVASRTAGLYQKAIADYEFFGPLGPGDARVENQMGLLYSIGPKRTPELAELHLRRANELGGGAISDTIKANLGGLLTSIGKFSEAHSMFAELSHMPENYRICKFFSANKVLNLKEFSEFVLQNREQAEASLEGAVAWLTPAQVFEARTAIQLALMRIS